MEDKNIDIEKQVENKIMLELLSKALNFLSDEDKKLIKLRFYRKLSEEGIAKIYGITQQAISKRLKEIYDTIKKFLGN